MKRNKQAAQKNRKEIESERKREREVEGIKIIIKLSSEYVWICKKKHLT